MLGVLLYILIAFLRNEFRDVSQMKNDEQTIRNLIDKWMSASKAGDIQTVLNLMTDDVIFLLPGQKPFGKKEFKESFEKMKNIKLDGKSKIEEIKILTNFAYLRNYLEITTTQGNKTLKRSGYTLTILRKENGQWKLARDANLLTEDK